MFFPKWDIVYSAVLAGDLLLFISGTAITWSSPVIEKLTNSTSSPFDHELSSEESSWVSSILTLGAAVSPFIYGYFLDKFGPKRVILSIGVPFLVSYVILACAKTTTLFYLARFLAGLAVGGTFATVPVYIGEITPKSNRGALLSTMSCAVSLGFLFPYCLGPYVDIIILNLVLAVFPVIFLVLFFLFGVECPHYYLHKQHNEMARMALKRIRTGQKDESIEKELVEIQTKIEEEGRGGFLDMFGSKGATKAFIIAVGLLIFQQFSGINAVLFYSQTIFKEVGTTLDPDICSIIVGAVQFLSSLVTPLVIDRYGRKKILICSAVGMALSEVPLGVYSFLNDRQINVQSVSFLPILMMTLFIVSYNSGFGPVPWIMLGEIFPTKVKTISTCTVSSVNWLLAFFITKYFKAVIDALGIGELFWVFAVCCVGSIIFTQLRVVETKGKSLEEIQNILSE
ncbi:facilitated trehalose transporter Tret1-2 homolog [Anoplophora glabripennis]|uniref:facilitated trehalose transporter Tret1-2 homolog n=1 Tax=Anoplophora glabripennis TaxID=217634 RepID=UPI00087594F1|nr:facilitated trehalose transporter Tret1-2 homolog [Anoplophora glabripennis]